MLAASAIMTTNRRAHATVQFLVKSSVYANRADASHGGGIYGATTVSLTQSSILSNTAAGSGGGLIYGSNIAMVDSTVSANSANNYGGGMWQNGALTLTRVPFAGNRAPYGGGIHHEAGALQVIVHDDAGFQPHGRSKRDLPSAIRDSDQPAESPGQAACPAAAP